MSDHKHKPEHELPPMIGNIEPGDNAVVLPVQFTAEGARRITGKGMDVPESDLPLRVQLVLQPDGHYGLRFVEVDW